MWRLRRVAALQWRSGVVLAGPAAAVEPKRGSSLALWGSGVLEAFLSCCVLGGYALLGVRGDRSFVSRSHQRLSGRLPCPLPSGIPAGGPGGGGAGGRGARRRGGRLAGGQRARGDWDDRRAVGRREGGAGGGAGARGGAARSAGGLARCVVQRVLDDERPGGSASVGR